MNKIYPILKKTFDIFFPNSCLNCQHPIDTHFVLCNSCIKRLPFNQAPTCNKCGRSFKHYTNTNTCYECKQKNYAFDRNYSVFQYKSPLINLIYNYKYNHILRIKDFLLEHLSEFLNFYDIINKHKIEIISAVPLHPSKLRERGYNQSVIIAKAIAAQFSLPYLETLEVVKYTRSQTRVKLQKRKLKVRGIFKARSAIEKSILLIDDVFTSGSTLNECASTLKANGAKQVITLTLCSTLK